MLNVSVFVLMVLHTYDTNGVAPTTVLARRQWNKRLQLHTWTIVVTFPTFVLHFKCVLHFILEQPKWCVSFFRSVVFFSDTSIDLTIVGGSRLVHSHSPYLKKHTQEKTQFIFYYLLRLVIVRALCCWKCLFLYGSFYYGALKPGLILDYLHLSLELLFNRINRIWSDPRLDIILAENATELYQISLNSFFIFFIIKHTKKSKHIFKLFGFE